MNKTKTYDEEAVQKRETLSAKMRDLRLNAASKSFIEAKHLQKNFMVGKVKVKALTDVSFSVKAGEFIAVSGVSGAGKSTLLHLLGGLDRPSAGAIRFAGKNLHVMTEDELTAFRKANVGFVFQFFNLIPTLTALENVFVSHMFDTVEEQDDTWNDAVELLSRMGLKNRLQHRPGELSGGEQQRVAIARALLNRPKLLLADEPTGNIDTESGRQIMELFSQMNREGTTIMVATHSKEVAGYAKRVFNIVDGKLVSD